MRRREFISLLGGAAAWPLTSQAQPRERVRRIGVLMHLAADDPDGQSRLAAFLQGVQEAGWIVGRNVAIDVRWAAIGFHRGPYGGCRRNGYYGGVYYGGAVAPGVVVAPGVAVAAPVVVAPRVVPACRRVCNAWRCWTVC